MLNHRLLSTRWRGFTTIELLVLISLMMIVLTATSGIFLLVSRLQKRIISDQQVQSDVRYALESMARDIHVSTIDYEYYGSSLISGGVVTPQSILALRDEMDQPVRYRLNGQQIEVCRGYICLEAGAVWNTLLSGNALASKLIFYIVPANDPFALCGLGGDDCSLVPNEQPRVTVRLTAYNVPEANYPLSTIVLQTTVLTRTYRR